MTECLECKKKIWLWQKNDGIFHRHCFNLKRIDELQQKLIDKGELPSTGSYIFCSEKENAQLRRRDLEREVKDMNNNYIAERIEHLDKALQQTTTELERRKEAKREKRRQVIKDVYSDIGSLDMVCPPNDGILKAQIRIYKNIIELLKELCRSQL